MSLCMLTSYSHELPRNRGIHSQRTGQDHISVNSIDPRAVTLENGERIVTE